MVKENSKHSFLKVKDHSVSGEYFQLIENAEYGFLETTPQPITESLPDYYKSEDYISHTDSKKSLTDRVYQIVKIIALKELDRIFHLKTVQRLQLPTFFLKKKM